MRSFLIIGLGRFGKHLAVDLIKQGHEVVAVESDTEKAFEASKYLAEIQTHDATSESFIKSLNVSQYDFCIVTIGSNLQNSLEITMLLKENGAKYIVSKANREMHKKFLKMAGADEVIYAEQDIAERLAIKYGSEKIEDYVKLSDDYSILEIIMPHDWVGHSLIELKVRQLYNINIIATKRDNKIYAIPNPDYIFEADETVVVMGKNSDLDSFIAIDGRKNKI